MITVAGLDLGTSGKSCLSVLRGENYRSKCIYMEAIQSVEGPDLETIVERTYAKFGFSMLLMEVNGPGEVFAAYLSRNKPHIPLATIDVSLPLPDDYVLKLWEDIEINNKLVLNVRMAMYWCLRLAFRDERIKLYKEDDELFAQLSTLRWDHDNQHGDKLYMISKRKLHLAKSELDEEPFSKSPDKADSLALGHFAYCLCQQDGYEDGEGEQAEDEIVEPTADGFFPMVGFDEDQYA